MQTTEARPAVKDENPILRVRAQAAIVRTLAAEMLRGDRGANQAEGLRNQAIEESARLVSVVEGLSRMRAAAPPAANGEPRQRESSAGARRRPRVLVVEEDDATRAAITRGLAPEYEVLEQRTVRSTNSYAAIAETRRWIASRLTTAA